MSTLEAIVAALGGRKVGTYYMAPCPAHYDRTPSLKLTEENGRLLVHDYGGCSQSQVITALRERGLWPRAKRREHPDEWGLIVRTFDYTDERSDLLYQICRFEPKSFRPRRPNRTKDGWTWGYGEVRRVLYRLPEVLEAPILFVTEGEKDVETLRDHGFVATTNAGGSNGWRDEFNFFFRDREVIIIPDDDPPGWRRAERITRGIKPVAARVLVLDDLNGAKDISEWFRRGHSEVELLHALEDCHARI